MGLLDDAIREHLELKRRRGADPGLVAREEQEALGSVPSVSGASAGEYQQDVPVGSVLDVGPASPEHSEPSVDRLSIGGQETAEIDMNKVLEAGIEEKALAEEDSLEWEVPGEKSNGDTDLVEESSTREAIASHNDGSEAEHVDDVLEETPDFLRDTPEQERLWFEQKPPRDFDFNE